MEKITKKDLLNKVAERVDGVKKSQVEEVFNAIFAVIGDELVAGNKVPVHEFGTFTLNHRNARSGINPLTKVAIQIEAKTIPAFKPSSALQERVKDVKL